MPKKQKSKDLILKSDCLDAQTKRFILVFMDTFSEAKKKQLLETLEGRKKKLSRALSDIDKAYQKHLKQIENLKPQ